MSFLLDTCVLSDMVSRQPCTRVRAWLDSVPEERLYLSVLTIGEIRKGIEKLPRSQRRDRLNQWLVDELVPRFAQRLITLDAAVMLTWGELMGRLEKNGVPMPAIDSLIAASALHAGLTLVTRNVADFAQAGVAVVNPWAEA